MKLALNIFLIAVFIVSISATRTETQTTEEDGTVKTVITEEWTEEQEINRGRGDGNTIVVMTNDDDHHRPEHSDHHDGHKCTEAKSYQDSDDQQCIKVRGSFADHCFDKYGGVAHGGQCFFLVPQSGDWNNAWTSCSQRGAQLAQVHADAEFAAVSAYLEKTCTDEPAHNGVWSALYRESGAADPGFYLNMDATKWYTAPHQPHKLLTAGNTWIRTRPKDCPFRAAYLCMVIWGGHKYNLFGDNPCSIARPALCQVTNENQKFTLAPNKCVAEVVIEKGSGSNADACAKVCARYGWCRSFNFRKNTRTCEYFSWSIHDGPKLMHDENCQHFSYKL